jgi:hypothetical protein
LKNFKIGNWNLRTIWRRRRKSRRRRRGELYNCPLSGVKE